MASVAVLTPNSEDGPGACIVEACSWDLTMGAATHVFGKLFLRTTSSSSHETPEAIDHVGIIAFNRLYEYGHNGIKKSNIPRNGEDPTPQYPGFKLRKREYLGRTTRSRGEFIEWIVNVKYGEFRGSNYDMLHHNCLDFAKSVCLFLRVPPNPNWEKISNWAKNNKKIAGFFTRPNCQGTLLPPGITTSVDGAGGSDTGSSSRRNWSLRQTGRSMTIPEESSTDEIDDGTPDPIPEYSTVVANSPRRRLSMNPPGRSRSRFSFGSRSASLETLPPTYEEAIKMCNERRESIQSAAPSYESSIKMHTVNSKINGRNN